MEAEINLKVDCVPVSIEISGNSIGVESGAEVEGVTATENRVNRGSEASGLILAGFQHLFSAGFTEARMSAALLGCIVGRCLKIRDEQISPSVRLPGNIWHVADRII